ncbi:unnamed protein product [Strongylus vulgaris]|uniref:Uncharacterized protein n=1 Tax=Strongylus vulgaris TaxID=40348 RepID=A0A3P7J593_STRVU|nr:unnamed protein product [Strongylus vulgaris]
MSKLDGIISIHSEQKIAQDALLKEKELQISSLLKELHAFKDCLAAKEELNSYLQSSISLICKRVGGEDMECPASYDRNSLEKQISALMQCITSSEDRNAELQADKEVLRKQMLMCREELEATKLKIIEQEALRNKEKTEAGQV